MNISRIASEILDLESSAADMLFLPTGVESVTPKEAATALRELAEHGYLNWLDIVDPERISPSDD